MATVNASTGDLLASRINGMLNVNATSVFNAIQGGSPLSILTSVLNPSYRILYSGTSEEALTVGGVAAVQPAKGAVIATAPVAANNGESAGIYSSFNKVVTPGKLTVRVIAESKTGYAGSVPDINNLTFTSQSDVLDSIDKMIAQTFLYDVETPKETFAGYDLTGRDYAVTARNGVTMLVINLFFQEVIQATEVILASQNSEMKPAINASSQTSSAVTTQVQSATKPVTVDTVTRVSEGVKNAASYFSDSVGRVKSGFTSALNTAGLTPEVVPSEAVAKIRSGVRVIAGGLS